MKWLTDFINFLMGERPSPPLKPIPLPFKCPQCGGPMHVEAHGPQCDNGICTAGYSWKTVQVGETPYESYPLKVKDVLGGFVTAPMTPATRDFIVRTGLHRWLVNRNAHVLLLHGWDRLEMDFDRACRFLHRIAVHDATKYTPEQAPGFAAGTHARLRGLTLSPEDEALLARAIGTHYREEAGHHPDTWHWFDLVTDSTWLSFLEIACDLQAMSLEKGETSFRKYLSETWLPKHDGKFSDLAHWNFKHCMETCLDIFEANPLQAPPWEAGK